MEDAPYDLSVSTISYNDDFEYRKTIRTLFRMEQKNFTDDVVLDEQDIDDPAMAKTLDWIFEKTGSNHLFQTLYSKAAGFMLSEDLQTGLCVLLAYDNLPLFHSALYAYVADPNGFNKKTPAYVSLHAKLFS